MIRNLQLPGDAKGGRDLLDDLGGEARAIVRLDRGGQSKPWDNVVEEEVSYCVGWASIQPENVSTEVKR